MKEVEIKKALMINAESVIELLKSNKVQSIEVRGAINAAIQLKGAIEGINDGDLYTEVSEEVTELKKSNV